MTCLHLVLSDPDDLRVAIKRGLVWHASPRGQQMAIDALIAGTVPMPDNLPPKVRAYVEAAIAERDK